MLAGALRAIEHTVPLDGLAALRFWGQTGERSAAWMAAADPVHLEARLDYLRLYAFRDDDISAADLRDLFNYLQKTLGDDERYTFARFGRLAYLRGEVPIATAAVSPAAVDGCAPDEFMPAGDDAGTHDLLLSELQMALHDHEVNQKRAASGKRSFNSIWLWGGGTAPEKKAQQILPLFADDPLFRGYWASCDGRIESWKENFDETLSMAADGFVAVAPGDFGLSRPEALAACLEDLREILRRGDLRRLTLLCRDGLTIDIRRHDLLRFWRKMSPLFMEADGDD
jgi:hypothetical protein